VDAASSTDLVAERLLQVIDEGQRTATYKLALLLALIDALAEAVAVDGSAPAAVRTRVIAEQVVRLYYPQVRQYVAHGGDKQSAGSGSQDVPTAGTAQGEYKPLRQISNKQSVTVNAVFRFHQKAGDASIDRARSAHPKEFEKCVDTVEENFARYPIRLLQVVGTQDVPFLYDIDWNQSVSLRTLHAPGGGLVRFRPGAADEVLRLAPLIRPLVELHWTRDVAKRNGLDLEGEQLRTHLFGAERAAFPKALRSALVDLQSHDCFYCGDRLGRTVEVDHFLPWGRWPNDAVENLVAADRSCNNNKRDHLTGTSLVERWATRFESAGDDLATIAADTNWVSAPQRTLNLLRAGYAHVPDGTPLWLGVDEMAIEDLASIRGQLSLISA
jgi:5-methylcytosine-specific restriction endonuclease McrA